MATPLLEMRGITKVFPGVKALDRVNLTVARRRDPRASAARTARANPR